jgi:hypothetical protein
MKPSNLNMNKNNYFPYGDTEIEYLKRKDRRLAEVIEEIGHIDRNTDDGLFSSVVL